MNAKVFSGFLTAMCLLSGTTAGANGGAPGNPTYAKDVAPIIYANCAECHRAGQMAPMSLMTYEEVRPWVKSIEKNVHEGTMPPWHADPAYGPFANDRSLTKEERDTLLEWARNGAPRGDLAELPEPPEFRDGEWKLGTPDRVVEFKPFDVPADGPDQFPKLLGQLQLEEDRWVRAIEILPGNAKVVHHVIVVQFKGFDINPEEGWIGAWAAGTDPMVFPEGTGRLINKRTNLIADMHYHPSGEPVTDVTRIGLHFVDEEKVKKELVNLWIHTENFEIPAGAKNHEVRARHFFNQDGFITAFLPHMHYRGQDFTYIAHFPDGREETLFRINDWDFNWQTTYTLEEPIAIPEGTVMEAIAHYDNSADNPDNPDPTKTITFGEETNDEMMIGFVDYVAADGRSPETRDETRERKLAEFMEKYPDHAYGVFNQAPDKPAPLYLPREGEGIVYLRVNGAYTPVRVFDVQWDGDAFTSSLDLPNAGTGSLNGKVFPQEGLIETTLKFKETEFPLNGGLVSKRDQWAKKVSKND